MDTPGQPVPDPSSIRWFLLRHGHSEANERHVVASQLAHAGNAFGLTGQGRLEVEDSVRRHAEELLQDGTPLLLSSPLLRAQETAAIAGELLQLEPQIDDRLRERNFGDLELLPDSNYVKVWQADAETPEDMSWNVETVYAVWDRVSELVLEVGRRHVSKTCILVTHCDTAMILTCAFQNIDPRHHRSLVPIQTGEIRRIEPINKAAQP